MAQITFPNNDLYKVLGVDSDASPEAIRKAYRELVKKVHPDKAEGGNTPENNARFQQVSEAWEILRDEVLRREYDTHRESAEDLGHDRSIGPKRRRKGPTGEGERNRYRRDRSSDMRSGGYEAKPNNRGKPYFEKWGHDSPSDSDNSSRSRATEAESEPFAYTSHLYDKPPFRRSSTTKGAQEASGASFTNQYGSSDPRAPPHRADSLADRLTAMHVRVDMRTLCSNLDTISREFQFLEKSFHTMPFSISDQEQQRWGKLYNDATNALKIVDNMYDELDLWVEDIEYMRKTSRPPACHLPAQFAYISAITTLMKYAATACVTIQGMILTCPYDPPQQYFDDLEERMKILIGACGQQQ
ncbi:DnaJ-domain-containing protein [Daldinia eschscholtzii]|nr:DnaJ-domain-containing protein [Daldinia eschscholtzii]